MKEIKAKYYSVLGEMGAIVHFSTKEAAESVTRKGQKRVVEEVDLYIKIFDSIEEYGESLLDPAINLALNKLSEEEYKALFAFWKNNDHHTNVSM